VADNNQTTDQVHLEQLELNVRIGVTDDERAKPQRLLLNITIWPKAEFNHLQDDIDKAVNYVGLCRSARELVEGREWRLIETVASGLASHLLATFELTTAEVEVRKFVLPKTEYVSATARRSAIG
jgi:FolB domain-containing protein